MLSEKTSLNATLYTAGLWTGFLVIVLLLLLLLLLVVVVVVVVLRTNRNFRDFCLFNINFQRRNPSSTRCASAANAFDNATDILQGTISSG